MLQVRDEGRGNEKNPRYSALLILRMVPVTLKTKDLYKHTDFSQCIPDDLRDNWQQSIHRRIFRR